MSYSPEHPYVPRPKGSANGASVPNGAVLATMLAGEDFENLPLGGFAGEMIIPRPEPQPQPQPAFSIPPPEWQHELESGNLDPALLAPLDAPKNELDALSEMKAANGDGYDAPPWRPIEPPLQPISRFVPPEPDWRLEEKERALRDREEAQRIARERRAELLRALLDEDEAAYPARKGKP